MRLIVHMGFHKTASTHLQALMNANHAAMAERGVWYEPRQYAAHHDIARLAAAYAFRIAQNHPFIDGNKRTSLVASRTFLILNGFQFVATQEEKYLTFLALAEGRLSEEELAAWLRARIQ